MVRQQTDKRQNGRVDAIRSERGTRCRITSCMVLMLMLMGMGSDKSRPMPTIPSHPSHPMLFHIPPSLKAGGTGGSFICQK